MSENHEYPKSGLPVHASEESHVLGEEWGQMSGRRVSRPISSPGPAVTVAGTGKDRHHSGGRRIRGVLMGQGFRAKA